MSFRQQLAIYNAVYLVLTASIGSKITKTIMPATIPAPGRDSDHIIRIRAHRSLEPQQAGLNQFADNQREHF